MTIERERDRLSQCLGDATTWPSLLGTKTACAAAWGMRFRRVPGGEGAGNNNNKFNKPKASFKFQKVHTHPLARVTSGLGGRLATIHLNSMHAKKYRNQP